MKKFICYSQAREQFNYKGDSLGMGDQRALYYTPSVGRGRVYRSAYPEPSSKNLKILTFDNEEKASSLCSRINEAYNDDFKPLELDLTPSLATT